MSQPQTSLELPQGILTQHAMLVAWGLSAQEMGLIEAFEQVEIVFDNIKSRHMTVK